VATRLAGKFPVSRHPPIRSKKWPCAQPINASEAMHFRLFNFRLSLPLFLFSQIILRSALNELNFQLYPPAPFVRSLYEFEDDLIKNPQGSRDCREEPGISTQGDNDFIRTVLVAQMITAWYDGDSDKRQHPRYRIKGITMARVIAGKGWYNRSIVSRPDED
jgi:hypothetical protein